MIDVLAKDPVLLVFVVMAIGAAAGSVNWRGVSLGPAAALFAGLGVGAIDAELSGASGLGLFRELGLVLFTYTIGLASGPTFLASVKRGGGRLVAATVALIAALAGGCWAMASALGLDAADRAGLFAGSTTNTPALQAATKGLESGDPVVAYSLAYPAAVVSMLVVITLLVGRRLPHPVRLDPGPEPVGDIVNWTVRVTDDVAARLVDLLAAHPGVVVSRVEHAGEVDLPTDERILQRGDCVVVLGPPDAVARLAQSIGERSDRHLPLDRSMFDFRRIAVSNRKIAGRRLDELALGPTYGVTATRIRRGDTDMVATPGTMLQLGDRVRVVGPVDRIAEVARMLGDSERRLGEVDGVGFALGIATGLALGTIDVPLPGGVEAGLGPGGGPLVVGLALGVISRTGPITWQLPHGANLVLRQVGILMFLAAAGLGSGTAFADAIATRRGAELVLAGTVLAAAFAAVVPLVVELVVHRDDVPSIAGAFAGIETQPAALSYAIDRTRGDDRVGEAYALVFPVAMITKIIAIQFLL